MNILIALFANFRWVDALDIVVVSFVIYQLLLLIREVHATRIVVGFGILFMAAAIASQFHLLTLDWLLSNVGPFVVISFVVVFQPDLRRIITQIGRGGFWGGVFQGEAALFQGNHHGGKGPCENPPGGLGRDRAGRQPSKRF